jgi:hypothetical protein
MTQIAYPKITKEFFQLLQLQKKALNKGQSLVDNIRRLERLYTQKDLNLI